MLTPHRPSHSGFDLSRVDSSIDVGLTLLCDGATVDVTHDGFTIGSSHHCDLTLADRSVPQLLCRIHMQSGAIWVEAIDDEFLLIINDRPYRRMALRHNDRMKIGTSEFTICLLSDNASMVKHAQTIVDEDLSLLTAEELCDRILSERSQVEEFTEGQKSGWHALLKAIEAANDETVAQESVESIKEIPDIDDSSVLEHEQIAINQLLEQIQQLNEAITDRTRELNEHEKEILEATSTLDEVQNRVAHRFDELLDQLNQNDPPSELRASA